MSVKDLQNTEAVEVGRTNSPERTGESTRQERHERIQEIDVELLRVSLRRSSAKDTSDSVAEQEIQYRQKLNELEKASGVSVSEYIKIKIRQSIVDEYREKERIIDELEIEKLQLLILTPEEERTIRQAGTEQREFKQRSLNGAEIVVHGMRQHVSEADDAVMLMKSTVDALAHEDPDIVLIEGGLSLEDFYAGEQLTEIMKKDAELVLKERGEQAYFAFLAMRDGKEVVTWDISLREQIRCVLEMKNESNGEKKWRPQDVSEWIIMYASRMAYTNGKKKATPLEIQRRIGFVLTPAGVADAISAGIELTEERIEAVLQEHMGHSSVALAERFDNSETRREDESKLIDMTEPELSSEPMVTREILRDMNIIRDKHAIGVFRDLQKRHPEKKLFVTAGSSHLTTWRPALEELYTQ